MQFRREKQPTITDRILTVIIGIIGVAFGAMLVLMTGRGY